MSEYFDEFDLEVYFEPHAGTLQLVCEMHGEYVRYSYDMARKFEKCPLCFADEFQQWKEQEKKKFYPDRIALIGDEIKRHIPKRFWNATIESYQATSSQLKSNKQKIIDFCKNPQEKNLVLFGKPGTGKTHLAYAIYKYLRIKRGLQGKKEKGMPIFSTALNIVRFVKETWDRNGESEFDTERQAIEHFSKCSLLIVDEVGVQFQSDTERMIITEILNNRYEEIKPIVLISNLELPALIEVLGERVIDRLKDGGEFLSFTTASYRGKK